MTIAASSSRMTARGSRCSLNGSCLPIVANGKAVSMGLLRGLFRAVGGLLTGVFGLLKGVLTGLGSLLRRIF